MKIAVLSDIHANLQALEAVLADCEKQGADRFWLLGDYVDYGADPAKVVERISALRADCIIAGNHDAALYLPSVRSSATPHGKQSFLYTKQLVLENPGQFALLQEISARPTQYLAERKTLLVHGTPEDPYWGKFLPGEDAGPLFSAMEQLDARLMVMGHSHVGFLFSKDGRTILNPGSVGQPRDGCPHASYLIVENDSFLFRRVVYDVDRAAGAIQRAGLPEYLWKRLYSGK